MNNCVLGQRNRKHRVGYESGYCAGRRRLQLSGAQIARFGFNASPGISFAALDSAWRRELAPA